MAGAKDTERSPLERVLGVITEVRAGEGITALLMTLNVFLLLTAYYVIKPVRKGLILAVPDGAKYESYLGAAIAVALLFAVPAYARVAGKLPKNKLVVGVTLFFASHLVVFWALSLIPSARQYLGLVFFVWVGIFNMMVVAQFWAFANDIYTQEQGKRLFALVGLGASVGAAAGAYITPVMKKALGVYPLLWVSGAMLVGCALLTQMAHVRERGKKPGATEEMPPPMSKQAKPARQDAADEGAFALVFKHRYLTLIAIFSLVFTWVNTNGEFMLSTLVTDRGIDDAVSAGVVPRDAVRHLLEADPDTLSVVEKGQKDALGKYIEDFGTVFFADLFLWVNILGVLLQTFAVSRIVKFGGLRLAFFIFPAIALLDASAIMALPVLLGMPALSVIRPGKIAENATDYSLNNTVRNMLWLPTTTEMKYKAKQAVDTFFVRMGDVASAGLVFVGTKALAWPVKTFAVANFVLVLLWIFLARGIVKENARLTEEQEKEKERAAEKEKAATEKPMFDRMDQTVASVRKKPEANVEAEAKDKAKDEKKDA